MFISCMSMLVALCVFTNLKACGFVSEAIVTGSDQLGKIIEAAGETGQSVGKILVDPTKDLLMINWQY